MRRTGYIAGPMRGIPLLNFPAFDRAAQLGRSKGHSIISPAEMDKDAGIDEQELGQKIIDSATVSYVGYDTELNAPVTPQMIRTFVRRDIDALLALRAENGDFIALLPDWFKSTGATAEVFVGRWLKLQFLDALTFEPWPMLPDGTPIPNNRTLPPAEFRSCGCYDTRKHHEMCNDMTGCHPDCPTFAGPVSVCGDGETCGLEKDLETAAMIRVAEDMANRKEL